MNVLNTFAKTSKGINTWKISYKTDGTEVAVTQGKDLAEVTCHNCGKKGHYAKMSPEKGINKGQVHTKVSNSLHEEKDEEREGGELGYVYHQNLIGLMWKTCLLIDSESSVDILNDSELLTRMYKAKMQFGPEWKQSGFHGTDHESQRKLWRLH